MQIENFRKNETDKFLFRLTTLKDTNNSALVGFGSWTEHLKEHFHK